MCLPSSRARRMPARTRSMMRLRSSSAMAPMMTTTARPSGPPGVDLLAEADELDVEPVQLIEHLEEMLHRAGDPVRGPDQQDVETAAAAIAHQGIEPRSPRPGAAHPVGILLDDLITPLLSHLAQIVELGLGVLIERRNPQIEDGALHDGRRLMPISASHIARAIRRSRRCSMSTASWLQSSATCRCRSG